MIQESELRDGNYVLYKDERSKHNTADLVQIDGVVAGWVVIDSIKYGTDDHRYPVAEIYPLPLTDEILLQFGFIEKGFVDQDQDDVEWMAAPGLPYLHYRNGEIILDYITLPHIKHLHQLQNLYYAFTGKELEMKPAKT